MQGKGFYRKTNTPGPGGWRCPCCAPASGQPKKKAKRKARKIFTRLIDKIEHPGDE